MSLEKYKINNKPFAAFIFGCIKLVLELFSGVAWYPERRNFYQFVDIATEPDLFMNAVQVNLMSLGFLAVIVIFIYFYNK